MARVEELLEWKGQGRSEGFAEGMASGMLEARRQDLLKVLRMRFPEVGYDITTGIRGMTNIDQLGRWFDAALVAPTLDHFRIMAADADYRAG